MQAPTQFTEREAVVLLSFCLLALRREISKKEAAARCSFDLRRLAVKSGYSINGSFRSESGIRGRLDAMESAWRGQTISTPASSLFLEVVNTYRNDYQRYKQILDGVKEIISREDDGKT